MQLYRNNGNRSPFPIQVAMGAFAFMLSSLATPCVGQGAEPVQFASSLGKQHSLSLPEQDLQQRGKQLRLAIQNEFNDLVKTNALQSRNVISSEIITRYIPIGSSLADAKVILQSADARILTEHPDGDLRAVLNLDAGAWFVFTPVTPSIPA